MIYKFKTGSEEWLKVRRKYVTATDMASLLGLNSYMSAREVFQSKAHPSKIDNQYLRDGKILEPAVIQALHLDLGMAVQAPCEDGYALVYTNEKHRISSTPDAFFWDAETPAIVECKTTSVANFEKNWKSGTPPLRYAAQVHTQMMTTGFKRGYLACIAIRPNIPLAVYELTASEEIDNMLIKRAGEFWAASDKGATIMTTKAVREKAADLMKESMKLVGFYEFKNEDVVDEDFDPADLFK